MSYLLGLECSRCGRRHDASRIQSTCRNCRGTLFCRYDLERAKSALKREVLAPRAKTMWRYRELLPVLRDEHVVTLGEGYTAILELKTIGGEVGSSSLLAKDDGTIPTGTFKARGQAAAISRAKELGIRHVALASAGNAGGAAATYAARAGLECRVFMPRDAPEVAKAECLAMGATVELIDGLISDAARKAAEAVARFGWFDLSTLKEPYRVEGKKTMGLEIAEQLGWSLPDVIIYPTGGGTGLVGMWKAFRELEELGWIGPQRPRMVAVQSEGCAPVVRAFEAGKDRVEAPFEGAETVVSGLRVPFPYASEQILKVLRESGGTAVAVKDSDLLRCVGRLARWEGLYACPEGAATLAALERLLAEKWVDAGEKVLLYNTGSGLKYPELAKLIA